MSVAASRHELESHLHSSITTNQSAQEADFVAKLQTISPPLSGTPPVIAIDLDDVLSQTNTTIALWHNERFGTDMTIASFYYYYYWKNPYWGTSEETFRKVNEFYASGIIHQACPVPGAREGVQALKNMGYRLIVVTARTKEVQNDSWAWIDRHFPDLFDSVVCTDQFKDAMKTGPEIVTTLSKAQVCHDINAQLLIDDSVENALACATAHPPTRALLFGDYQWNKRISAASEHGDEMSYEIRLKNENGREFWETDKVAIPEGAPLWRVKDWSEVVMWIARARQEGTI